MCNFTPAINQHLSLKPFELWINYRFRAFKEKQ